MNRPSETLLAFVKFLEKDQDLQLKARVAENPQQTIDIAESTGFTISLLELGISSSDLTADYFPWPTKDREYRHNFFKGKGLQ